VPIFFKAWLWFILKLQPNFLFQFLSRLIFNWYVISISWKKKVSAIHLSKSLRVQPLELAKQWLHQKGSQRPSMSVSKTIVPLCSLLEQEVCAYEKCLSIEKPPLKPSDIRILREAVATSFETILVFFFFFFFFFHFFPHKGLCSSTVVKPYH
jgi:hypothetical protein